MPSPAASPHRRPSPSTLPGLGRATTSVPTESEKPLLRRRLVQVTKLAVTLDVHAQIRVGEVEPVPAPADRDPHPWLGRREPGLDEQLLHKRLEVGVGHFLPAAPLEQRPVGPQPTHPLPGMEVVTPPQLGPSGGLLPPDVIERP